MPCDNHQAYVAIPMNLFSSAENNDEAPSSSSRRRAERCRQFCTRDSHLVPKLTAVVLLVVLLVPLWMRHHHYNYNSNVMNMPLEHKTGGDDGCMKHWRKHQHNKHDLELVEEDVVVMKYEDEPSDETEMIHDNVVFDKEEQDWPLVDGEIEEEVEWEGEEVSDDAWFDDVEPVEEEEEEDDDDDVEIDEEAVDEPMQYFASVESSSEEEDTPTTRQHKAPVERKDEGNQ